MTTLVNTRVTVLADGTVPIQVRCVYTVACVGAIGIGPNGAAGSTACGNTPAVPGANVGFWAQGDLRVPAGAVRTLGITLSSCAHQLLAQHHTLSASVLLDTVREAERTQRGHKWTGLADGTVTLVGPG